ncbi:phosphate ABC transporter permease subunit PstC [Streptomyces spongiae]|uniref:Phosphate transport system permease protein n=1 Tax=Streptomyces spongiae TaxID=565072 RepID=A0A5N8XZE7_9ACTN|nr:phosphate ABC transporter permease subunit PstC [Streptomyces spongiae]MPY64612.1 phosphate ABC transporter permease subunit PstC [Streptomyces spongiae]
MTPAGVRRRAAPGSSGFLRRSQPRYVEKVVKVLLVAASLVSVLTTVGIVIALIPPSVEFFGKVSFGDFITGTDWSPLFKPASFGVLPLVTGTLVITLIALVVAVPLGLGAAVYLSEYARPRVRSFFKPILEVLAGIPTVVYGFFALQAVTPLLQDIWPGGDGPEVFNALSAGFVMGIMIIPTIASLSEDAMNAVPNELRDGGYALGSSRMQVSTRVVFPAALSGIVAAIVLGVSRAIGETLIVAIAAGGRPNLSFNPLEGMQTMTAFIAAAGIGDLPTGSIGYQTIFAVGTLLFVMTLVMNLVSIRLVRKYRQVYE